MPETLSKSKAGRILWFSPILLLWAVFILPSSFHAVWGSLDDGVTLTVVQNGPGACFNMNAGRIVPFYWLHSWLLYQIGGLNPAIWYAIQSFEFLIAVLLIYGAIGSISNNWPAGALAAGAALTSAPIAENAYTISKCEPRLMLFLAAAALLAAMHLKAAAIQTSENPRHAARWFSRLALFLVLLMVVFTKESGIAVFSLGIAGMAASFVYLKQPIREKAIRYFGSVSVISLSMVVLVILLRAHALRITDNAYTSIHPTVSQSLANLKSYLKQSPDILMIAAACLIFGTIHLIRQKRAKEEPFDGQSRIAAIMAWSTLAVGMSYFLILLIWRMNGNYYMLPVGVCVSLSLGYFICSTKSSNPNHPHRGLRWAAGFLLMAVAVSRLFSIPYLHFAATAERGFDMLEDQAFKETLQPHSAHRRLIDIGSLYFVERPHQRDRLYRIFGAPDHSWVGARDLIRPYSEATRKEFGVKDPSPLEKDPPNVDDLLVAQSCRCPFDIEVRGVTPHVTPHALADEEIRSFEGHTGLAASPRRVLGSAWTVFKPWSLKMDTLEFKSVICELKEGTLKRLVWEGRYSDGWIGREAALQIEEREKAPPGVLRFRTNAHPWAVPIRITITGETAQTIELDSTHLDRALSMDTILPSRRGKIQIAVSKTWVLQKYQPDSKEIRELGVQVDYEPGVPLSR
jgi:hypothetical protein